MKKIVLQDSSSSQHHHECMQHWQAFKKYLDITILPTNLSHVAHLDFSPTPAFLVVLRLLEKDQHGNYISNPRDVDQLLQDSWNSVYQ
eukprot:5747530-Karenia_brevis.AAC.1